jgi:alpha-tubulin suppressor-like RCC1 family protein
MFGNLVYQMAAGNVSSLCLCIDENRDTFMVGMGAAITEKEGVDECEESLITLESSNDFEIVPSLPYRVPFTSPVSSVFCGDEFTGLLTVQGLVYTWGSNAHGQLGVDNSEVMYVQRPN